MTPTRLREIATQLEHACSAYQEKITRSGYMPCRTCREMAEELRDFAKAGKPERLPELATDVTELSPRR